MLQQRYNEIVVPAMTKDFGYKNKLQAPRILKVVVNTGVGRLVKDEKLIEQIGHDLALITGQAPDKRPAKKSIAGFKLREGVVVGLRVTLRGKRMYDFLSRLVNIALPRSRDFRGLNLSSVDQGGNLTIPVREHIVFPEVSAEQVRSIFGFEATVVTNAETHDEALALYRKLGFPFKAEEEKKGRKRKSQA